MKKNLHILLLSSILALLVSSCYYDSEEYLYPNTMCDTTNITYSGTISPILTQNCITCHSGAGAYGSILLDTYANVSVYAANGRLGGSVSHASGYRPMPEGLPKLDDCAIAKIQLWIAKGYPNN